MTQISRRLLLGGAGMALPGDVTTIVVTGTWLDMEGNPATNPSRAFDDHLHATLDRLGPDLGCR